MNCIKNKKMRLSFPFYLALNLTNAFPLAQGHSTRTLSTIYFDSPRQESVPFFSL